MNGVEILQRAADLVTLKMTNEVPMHVAKIDEAFAFAERFLDCTFTDVVSTGRVELSYEINVDVLRYGQDRD